MNELLKGKYIGPDYVCIWNNWRVIEPNYLTRVFHKGISESTLPTVRLHDLRHSAASNLLNMGFTVAQVAERFGESSSTTAFYWGILFCHIHKRTLANA